MSELIFYTTEDVRSEIKLRADLGAAWLTQREMADFFQTTKRKIDNCRQLPRLQLCGLATGQIAP